MNKNTIIKTLSSISTSSPSQSNLYAEHVSECYSKLVIERDVKSKMIEILKRDDVRAIILTGNAGDGKTTLCNELSRQEEFNIELDFSALSMEERTKLTTDIISRKSKNKYLIAANEGALIYSLNELKNKFPEVINEIESSILGLSDFDGKKSNGIYPLNLNKINNSSDGYKLIKKILEVFFEDHPCPICSKTLDCHIHRNLTQLKNEHIKSNLIKMYDFVHLTGEHLTIRDILIHLSYIITSGVSCDRGRSFLKSLNGEFKIRNRKCFPNGIGKKQFFELREKGCEESFFEEGLMNFILIEEFGAEFNCYSFNLCIYNQSSGENWCEDNFSNSNFELNPITCPKNAH